MAIKIIYILIAAALGFLAFSGTSDGNRNEGKTVMLCFSAEFLALGIFHNLAVQLWDSQFKILLILLQLGTAAYFVFILILAVYAIINTAREGCRFILVPGTTLDKEKPSPLLEGRLIGALDYIKDTDTVCVVSGGQVNDEVIPEGTAMFNWFLQHGVKVYPETKSQTTLQNFRRSLILLKEYGFDVKKDVLAVATDRFHFARCVMLAKHEGYGKIKLIPAKSLPVYSVCWYFREVLVYIKYAIEGLQ